MTTPTRLAEIAERPFTTHVLKVWPPYFEGIASGKKTFEVRLNDRDFRVGDVLDLVEYDMGDGAEYGLHHTGRSIRKVVDYILDGGQFGVEPGYVVMALTELILPPVPAQLTAAQARSREDAEIMRVAAQALEQGHAYRVCHCVYCLGPEGDARGQHKPDCIVTKLRARADEMGGRNDGK